jgi:hypothetical protein
MSNERTNTKSNSYLTRLTAPIVKHDRQANIEKYKDVPPHKNLHNFHTIKWLRSRFNHSVFNRSINTMLPNNGAPVEDPDKEMTRMDKAKAYLQDYCKASDKFKNFHIPPKYLYSQLVMTKIKKLLDIFLEFDEDGSRKLEIGEMVVMFNTNKIPVEEEELVGLFFKDKKLRKDEEPYLDFYQFMLFALSKACDQDFRSFMRKLKKKKADESKAINANHYKSAREVNKQEEPDEENLFLPMNFNLVLDYFNNKGKQRDSQAKIQEALDIMEEIIKIKDKKNENHETIKSQNSQVDSDDSKSMSVIEENENQGEPENDLDVHNKIDTEFLFSEFKKLFGQKHASEHSNNTNRLTKKILGKGRTNSDVSHEMGRSGINYYNNNNAKVLPTHISSMQTKTLNDENLKFLSGEEFYANTNHFQMPITNFLREKMEKEEKEKTSLRFYDKYKSLNIAAEETKKLFDPKYSKINTFSSNSTNSNFRKTTKNSTNFNFLRKDKELKDDKFLSNTNNFFYNSKYSTLNSNAKSTRTNRKEGLPNLPEITHRKKTIENDYVPLKLLKELKSSNLNSGNISKNDLFK